MIEYNDGKIKGDDGWGYEDEDEDEYKYDDKYQKNHTTGRLEPTSVPLYSVKTTIYIWVIVILCIFLVYFLNMRLSPMLSPIIH